MTNIINNINFNIFFIIFFLIFIIRNILELFLKPKDKHKKKSEKIGKKALFFFTLLYLGSGTAVYIYLLFDKSFNLYLFFAGNTLLLSAFFIRMIVLQKIKNSFSIYINNSDKDILVTSGIYRIIRHPAYLFYSLEMSAFLLIRFNFFSFSAFVVDLIITIIRIRDEEKFLIDSFNNKYKNYQENTWKMIPFVY